ncbi:Suppressor of mec-8 and unc-52 protein homolog 2, partial [Striga hermonthica]
PEPVVPDDHGRDNVSSKPLNHRDLRPDLHQEVVFQTPAPSPMQTQPSARTTHNLTLSCLFDLDHSRSSSPSSSSPLISSSKWLTSSRRRFQFGLPREIFSSISESKPIVDGFNPFGNLSTTYNMWPENGFSHDIPNTVHRSKADCPVPEEMVTVSIDGSVQDRIAKIMSYLCLGSLGKVLKKKKRKKMQKVNH